MTSLVRSGRLDYLVYAGILGFLLCMAIAIEMYPGGNLWDRAQPGYDFWRNFWCDLQRQPAYNGAANRIAPRFAQLAMLCLALGIAAYFALAPRLFGRGRRLGQLVTAAGWCGAAGLVAVAAISSRGFPTLHGVAVLAAGPMGLIAVLGTVVGLARSPAQGRLTVLLGAAMLAVSLFTLTQYVREFVFSAPSSEWLPRSQKLATVLALGWMCVVSAAAVRARGPSG
ncbi:MAG TPA: hypothetical protein VI197_30845 [Polyangiaceae bacterium]